MFHTLMSKANALSTPKCFITKLNGTALNLAVLNCYNMTRFGVFGGGWVQSTTLLGFFSFHDFLFLLVYMQAYI